MKRGRTLLLFIAGLLATANQFQMLWADAGLGRGMETTAIARSLVSSGRFADPFGVDTGPTAQQAPLFPALLAAAMWAGGEGPAGGAIILLLVLAAHAAQYPLLPVLSERICGSRAPGYWGCLWLAVIPTMTVYVAWADGSLIALGVMAFCAGFARLESSMRAAGAGVAAGLLSLLHPPAAAVTAPWMWVATREDPLRRRKLLIFALAAVVVCLPWLVRNYSVFGEFVPIRDNFGLELQVSHNDLAEAALLRNTAAQAAFHPNINAAEAALAREAGETAYFRAKQAAAVDWIRRHPARFASLTIQRIREFWLPDSALNGIPAWSAWAITALSLAGLAARQGRPAWRFVLPILLLYPLPYYLVQADLRYRLPVLWLSLLPACAALMYASGWLRERWRPGRGR